MYCWVFLHRPSQHPEPGRSGNLPCEKLECHATCRLPSSPDTSSYILLRQSFVNSPGNYSKSVMLQLELVGYLLVETTDVPADIGSDRGETFSFILSYNWLNSSRSTYSPQSVGTCISDDGGRRNRSSMIWKNNWAKLTITTLTLVLLEPYIGLYGVKHILHLNI